METDTDTGRDGTEEDDEQLRATLTALPPN
jgi:hypothetical protein